MSRLQALQQYADRLQRRHAWLAFPLAAWKKFSDDRAGYLAALIAYYAFVSLFPLFLALVTILDLVLASHETFREHIVDSALASYPVIGQQLKSNVHALSSAGPALAIGLIGTLFGARGLALATQNALNAAWAVPYHRRPMLGRSLAAQRDPAPVRAIRPAHRGRRAGVPAIRAGRAAHARSRHSARGPR